MSDIELDYGAITLDTNILKSEGFRFDDGLLKLFAQFKNSPVKVLQTDIVNNEVAHMSEDIRGTQLAR